MKRNLRAAIGVGVLACAAGGAGAENVYLMSSLHGPTDTAAMAALTSRGHTVTLGLDYANFSGSVSLAGFDTVYLQANSNWTSGVMPLAGQQQLVDWVNAGGRLVVSEWVGYYTYIPGGYFLTLAQVIPVESSFNYGFEVTATYSQITPDPALNAGVPTNFTFPLVSYDGTELWTGIKAGATMYYDTAIQPGSPGLAGWTVGSGRVLHFTSTCGPAQVADPNFGRLFANAMGDGNTCYPDCNGVGGLTIADFGCFQTKFVAGDPYADCNGVGGLTIADFGCFQTKFVAGCP